MKLTHNRIKSLCKKGRMYSVYLKKASSEVKRAIRTGDWSRIEAIDRENESSLRKLYEALVAGEINIFYTGYKEEDRRGTGTEWRNVVAWHRSTRSGVLVQESHMWFKNGECIPFSHQNINSFDELMKERGYLLGAWYKTA